MFFPCKYGGGGEGACQSDIFTKYRLGCELSYGTCMGHVPSFEVLCSPCYSRWCYGQVLAIAPLQSMYGRQFEKNT